MTRNIQTITEFADGLCYQLRFGDYRMLDILEQDGMAFLHLARAFLDKERRLNSRRGARAP